MTDDHTRQQRIEQEPYLLFFTAFNLAISEYFSSAPEGPGFDLQVACALLPGRRKLFELQVQPEGVSPELIDGLIRRLESLPCRRVRRGPVSFFLRKMIWGGCAPGQACFSPAFERLIAPLADEHVGSTPIDDLLMRTAGLKNAPETWWSRMKRLLGSSYQSLQPR